MGAPWFRGAKGVSAANFFGGYAPGDQFLANGSGRNPIGNDALEMSDNQALAVQDTGRRTSFIGAA